MLLIGPGTVANRTSQEIEHLKDVGHELIELIALRSLPIMKALVDLRDHPAEELPDALQQMKSDLEAYDV